MYMRSDLTSTMPNLQQNASPQTSWDPSTISNVVFGIIMVFVGLVAIWQGRHKRFIALDEGRLAVIEPPPRSRSPPHFSYIELGSGIPLSAHHTPSGTSTALPSMAQLGTATGERTLSGIPRDHIVATQMVSDRTYTLSLIGCADQSTQHIQGLTAQLDIIEIEGCEHCEDPVDEQRTSREVVDPKKDNVF